MVTYLESILNSIIPTLNIIEICTYIGPTFVLLNLIVFEHELNNVVIAFMLKRVYVIKHILSLRLNILLIVEYLKKS